MATKKAKEAPTKQQAPTRRSLTKPQNLLMKRQERQRKHLLMKGQERQSKELQERKERAAHVIATLEHP